MFGIVQMPRKGISELKFKDFLDVKDKVIDKEQELQELNNRAAGEVVIRQALSELDVWEIDAKFTFIEHQASTGEHVPLIKDWKDVLNKVSLEQCKSVHFCKSYYVFDFRLVIIRCCFNPSRDHLTLLHLVTEPLLGKES